MTRLGSLQPAEVATPVAFYTANAARCVCEATINLCRDGEWRHHSTSGNTIWCPRESE